MSEKTEIEKSAQLPHSLHYGQGLSITLENLVAQAALLNSILGGHMNTAAMNLQRDPLTYPEAMGLHELSSTIYFALAENVYRDEVEASIKNNRPAYI